MAPLVPAARPPRAKERPLARSAVALLVSLAVNAAALGLIARSSRLGAVRPADPAAVALAPVGASQWRANREIRAPERPRRQPPPPDPRGRVVEIPSDRPTVSEPPDTKFLSDRNTRAERETVSRRARSEPPSPGPEAAERSRLQGGLAARERPAARRQPAKDRGRRGPARERAGAPPGPAPDARAGGSDGGAGRPPDLRVREESLARIAGGPGMDGFGEVEEGEETWLSSREFRFATFLNQMRREIGDVWYPRVRSAVIARDPEGTAFFHRERTVVLAVTLDEDGTLRALTVLQSSRIEFVDAIAVASVREAQPFPNPPRAMFEDGPARIPFAFTIHSSERRRLEWRPPRR